MSTHRTDTIDLAVQETLALRDIRGTTLQVTRGSVWITQQDDTADVVLTAGDRWTVERDGLTIVEAQRDATLRAVGRHFATSVSLAPRRKPSWSLRWRRFQALFAAVVPPLRNPYPHV